ncbi:2-phosphosulfolactate phosphatase [Catellatospora sichuanensis]|uniref:2-phosphosulfolactate phosphatase n=1 Tax=Catellatospora sichuanensis TaxID=1969805 RepID=UPI0011832ABB|nr:2-phosphosulfolactate phosphatase [Catellatospora sichuanensis]
MINPYSQAGHRVRFDWGPSGADVVGAGASVVAVVDVLSFTTALAVAADQGIEVFPYRWRDASAQEYARRHDAVLAVGRSQVDAEHPVSLSPVTIRAASGVSRLVLPSPNGSTIAQRLAEAGATVIGVSLRNAAAAAAWTASRLSGEPDTVVAVVAAGERWRADESLRPAVEDFWGAGAFVDALDAHGFGALSPEAEAAAAAYQRVAGRLPAALHDCASGRELIGNGYPQDVAIAAEVGASRSVPVLSGASFRVQLSG